MTHTFKAGKKSSTVGVALLLLSVALFAVSCDKKQVVEKYPSGKDKLVHIMSKQDGKLQKVGEEMLYENGRTRLKGRCKGERREGVWKFYFQNGKIFAQADFTDSQSGEKWSVYDTAGNELVSPKDKLLEARFASDGGLCDIRVRKNKDEVFYKFFESFKVQICAHLKGNIPNGETVSYFENGQLNSYYFYRDGIQDSIYKVYTETGGTLLSGRYRNGKKVGKWEYFLSDGTPAGIEIYDEDGTLLKGRQ